MGLELARESRRASESSVKTSEGLWESLTEGSVGERRRRTLVKLQLF
jgi:hypothetical protein